MNGSLFKTLANAKDKKAICHTIYQIGESRDKKAIQQLVILLKDIEDIEIKSYIAEAMVKIGGRKTTKLLCKLLKSPSWITRMKVAEIFGELGNAKALNALIKQLKIEKNKSVIEWIIISLGKIGKKKATKILIEKLLNSNNTQIKIEAADALGKINDKRALKALYNTYQSDHEYPVRWTAAAAIAKIEKEKAKEIMEDLTENLIDVINTEKDEIVLGAAARTLGEIGDEIAAKVLYKTMKISKEIVRLEINLALGKMAKRFKYKDKEEFVRKISSRS